MGIVMSMVICILIAGLMLAVANWFDGWEKKSKENEKIASRIVGVVIAIVMIVGIWATLTGNGEGPGYPFEDPAFF
jgi:putative copper export protein